ncbi:MAG TPA: hypothetical protein VMU81_23680 [Acetobacteraceae bacterium]|jgi:hypothetical protein|nr:hypothetical protein [Acetobacteraceae bacterium]
MPDGSPLPQEVQQNSGGELLKIVQNLVTLRVTTVIAAARVDPASATNLGAATAVTVDANDQVVASTAINMALGDVTQIFHPDFEAKPDLAKLHQDAIATARAIRSETITILTTLAKDIAARL